MSKFLCKPFITVRTKTREGVHKYPSAKMRNSDSSVKEILAPPCD